MQKYEALFRSRTDEMDKLRFDEITDYILSMQPLDTEAFKQLLGSYIRFHRQVRRIHEKIELLYNENYDNEIRETEYRKWCIEYGFISEKQ